jgi:hypothetical protein
MDKREFNLRDFEPFDTRTVQRHIKRGVVEGAAYEKHLEEIEDCSFNAVESGVYFVYSKDGPEQEVIITPEMVAARQAELAALNPVGGAEEAAEAAPEG